jgi:hypothetical protein
MQQIDSTTTTAGAAGGFPSPGLHGAIWGQLALLELFLDADQGPIILVLLLLLLRLELMTMCEVRMVVTAAFVHGCSCASTSKWLEAWRM